MVNLKIRAALSLNNMRHKQPLSKKKICLKLSDKVLHTLKKCTAGKQHCVMQDVRRGPWVKYRYVSGTPLSSCSLSWMGIQLCSFELILVVCLSLKICVGLLTCWQNLNESE